MQESMHFKPLVFPKLHVKLGRGDHYRLYSLKKLQIKIRITNNSQSVAEVR